VSLGRYALVVFSVTGISLAVLLPFLDTSVRRSVVAGGGLATMNTLLAHSLVLISGPRSTNAFVGIVLGGMVGRMGLMLAALVTAVLVFGLPRVPLAIALLSYFALFLALELAVLQKGTR
jgi:hypothetical protein